MARNRTQIEGTDFVKIAQHCGLDIVPNKGWTKCYRPGSKRIGVGIPNTKQVTRIELVGFTHPHGVAHPKPPAKTVEQELNWNGDRKEVLQRFYEVCKEALLGLPATDKKATSEAVRVSKESLIEEFEAAYAESSKEPAPSKEDLIKEFEAEFAKAA